jgi:hypothetical protein
VIINSIENDLDLEAAQQLQQFVMFVMLIYITHMTEKYFIFFKKSHKSDHSRPAEATGPQSDRIAVLKQAFKNQFKSSFVIVLFLIQQVA